MPAAMIFGYPIWVSDDAYQFTQDEVNFISGLDKLEKPGTENQITSDGYIFNHPELLNIKEFCQDQINLYFHELMQIDEEQTEIYITQSWANYNQKGQNHDAHHHPNSILSAVFYVTSDNVPVTIKRPQENIFQLLFNLKNLNEFNSNEIGIAPTSGQILIFPSTLQHFVPPNTYETERVSISMNTFVRGIMGSDIGRSELKL